MSEPIELDLRRDLPKVRQFVNYDGLGQCQYASPCAIGAMMPEGRRARFDRCQYGVTELISVGRVIAPRAQIADLDALQRAFDGGVISEFDEVLAELESKYLSQPEASGK